MWISLDSTCIQNAMYWNTVHYGKFKIYFEILNFPNETKQGFEHSHWRYYMPAVINHISDPVSYANIHLSAVNHNEVACGQYWQLITHHAPSLHAQYTVLFLLFFKPWHLQSLLPNRAQFVLQCYMYKLSKFLFFFLILQSFTTIQERKQQYF